MIKLADMVGRETGFYWVQLMDGNWAIAKYWAALKIWDCFQRTRLKDKAFLQIDEKRIVRQE